MLKKLAVALVVLVAAGGFLLLRDWDSPKLGRAVLAKVGDSTGIHIEAESFKLNVFKGLVLRDVRGTAPGAGGTLTFSLDELVFEHRLMPLFSGTVSIDRVVVDTPQLEFVSAASSTSSPAGAAVPSTQSAGPKATTEQAPARADVPTGSDAGASNGLMLDVRLVRIERGSMIVRQADGPEQLNVDGLTFEMTDLRLDPSRTGIGAVSARGTLSVDTVQADAQTFTDLAGAFELADARFAVPELRLSMASGTVTADTTIDFNPVPLTYALHATSQQDLNVLVGTPGGLGPATARFDARGTGPDAAGVSATGTIELAPGQFPASPLFTRVDQALGKPVLSNAPYEATTLSFRLSGNRLTLEPFRLTTPSARLDLSGDVVLDGPLDMSVALATPREGLSVEGTSASVLDVLADNEGWVPVPLAISGTLEDPRVRPDGRALASMASAGAKREATEKATDALKGLIKRKIR